MIEIKTTTQLLPGDVILEYGAEYQVEQIIRLRKSAQIMFNVVSTWGDNKPFTILAYNTKEWRVTS